MAVSRLFLALFVRGKDADDLDAWRHLRFTDTDKMNQALTQAYEAVDSEELQGDDSLFKGLKLTHVQLMIENPKYMAEDPNFEGQF